MTRIAYISADLGVPVFGRKGCSIHAQEVLGAFLRLGAQVALFSPRAEGEPTPALETLEVHNLPLPPKGDVVAREQAALGLNSILHSALESSDGFDFIYERYSLWSYAAMEFARANGIPGLLEVNAPLIQEQMQYRVLVDRAGAERAANRAFAAATALLAVSQEVARWLEEFPGARGKIHVVPNGIRPERFPAGLAPSLPAAEGVFTVGFVGTLKVWHGVSILIDAFALLHARDPRTRLLIVGDGPEREKIEAELTTRKLAEAAVCTGAVAPEQVPGLLASMDVAVAPYPLLDNFYFSPLKVYEYMAAGVAVVASRIGQLQTLIESGRTGLLVPPGDPAALTSALQHLGNQPDLRVQLGQAARQLVMSKFTWDAVAARIFELARLGRPAARQVSVVT